jgi:centromere protein J
MSQHARTPYQSRITAPRPSIQQSVQRFAQLADTPCGDISRLLSLSEGGTTPEMLPTQALQDLADYMKSHSFFQTPRPFDEPSRSRPFVEQPTPTTVFRDRSNTILPITNHQRAVRKNVRDPTPMKQPPPPLTQRQPSLDDLAGLKLLPSPAGSSRRMMNHSSLLVELSHEEEEDDHHHHFDGDHARAMTSSPMRKRTMNPLEPDQAQSPIQEPSILLGATEEYDLDLFSLRKPQMVSNDESERVVLEQAEQELDDHFFLFDSNEMTSSNATTRPNRLSLHLPSTPTILVDSQLQELESKRPKTPQDARQWLQTAVVALQDARNEREAARQWARDMKTAVNKWASEQQRLVQLEASSHLCDTLQHLESLIFDLKSLVQSHHERQDSSQSHLQEMVLQQQAKLQDLFDQLPRMENSKKLDPVEPFITPPTTATSPPGLVAHPPRQSMDASSSSSRVQRLLPKGAGRLIVYSSGVEKELYKDGTTVIRFPNGDVETKLPDKTVAYFHAAEQVMQITQPDQSVLLEYPNGQVERHYVDGSKAILFPNGQKVKLDPSGEIQGYEKKK